jgi:hypothetical protein
LLIGPFPLGHGAEKCVRAIGDAKTGRTLSARTLRSSDPRQSPPADAPGMRRDELLGLTTPYVPSAGPSHDRGTSVKRVDECPRALLAPPPRGSRSARTGPHRTGAACRRHTTDPRRSPGSRAARLDAPTYALRLRPKGEGLRRRARASQSRPPLWRPAVGPGMAPTVRLSAASPPRAGQPPQLATSCEAVQRLPASR